MACSSNNPLLLPQTCVLESAGVLTTFDCTFVYRQHPCSMLTQVVPHKLSQAADFINYGTGTPNNICANQWYLYTYTSY